MTQIPCVDLGWQCRAFRIVQSSQALFETNRLDHHFSRFMVHTPGKSIYVPSVLILKCSHRSGQEETSTSRRKLQMHTAWRYRMHCRTSSMGYPSTRHVTTHHTTGLQGISDSGITSYSTGMFSGALNVTGKHQDCLGMRPLCISWRALPSTI